MRDGNCAGAHHRRAGGGRTRPRQQGRRVPPRVHRHRRGALPLTYPAVSTTRMGTAEKEWLARLAVCVCPSGGAVPAGGRVAAAERGGAAAAQLGALLDRGLPHFTVRAARPVNPKTLCNGRFCATFCTRICDRLSNQVIPPIGAEGLNRRPPAGSCRLFLGPGFRLGARWNRLVETVKTRKKREKTGGKWP